MKLRKLYVVLIGLLFNTFLYSQNYMITGTVETSAGQPLEFATVSIFQKENNKLITGGTTDNLGKFSIAMTQEGTYDVVASYLESKSETVSIELTSDFDVGTLLVRIENQLDEVEVLSEKPKFERKADRYVFTVEKTSLNEGSISDLLSRTPGLIVLHNKIFYKGETNMGVMINEKLINLPPEMVWDVLKNSSAGTVQAVEVITNPPARYSAEGNVLINIKMKGNLLAGYNGSVNTTFGQGNFPRYGFGTDHFFKTKTTALTLGYGFSDRKIAMRYFDVTNFNGSGLQSRWAADQNRVRNNLGHTLNLFYDISLDKNTTVSITSINQISPREDQDIITDTQITGETTEGFNSFLSNNLISKNLLNSSTYLEFDKKFLEGKKRFSSMAHFTYFENERNQEIFNSFFDTGTNPIDQINFNTLSKQQIRIFTAKADYESKIGAKSTFSLGAKFAGIDSNSELAQEGVELLGNGIAATDGSFNYDEQIYAGYSSLRFSWEKTDISVGLRTEYTRTRGEQLATAEVFRNNYLEWFPNFSFKKDLAKERSVMLYYYRRISRPRYEQINPFQLFQGFNSTVEGNPRLQPATRHYVAGVYNFNKWIGVELFYRYRRNQLRRLTFQDNANNLVRFISSNVNRELGYGIDVIINKKITSFWKTYFIGTYFDLNNRFQDAQTGIFATTSSRTFQFTNNNTFTLLPSKDLFIDLDIRYRSPYAFGNTRGQSTGSINLSVQKRFFEKRASFTVGVTDIFSQGAYLQERRFLDQDNTSFIDPEVPLLNISFRYRFGNTRIKKNKKRKRQGEVQRL